jgi:hypothetical protein
VTISSGLCRLFAISDPPFPNYDGGPTQGGRTNKTYPQTNLRDRADFSPFWAQSRLQLWNITATLR